MSVIPRRSLVGEMSRSEGRPARHVIDDRQKSSSPIIPAPHTAPIIFPSRSRIHRKALRRGRAGAFGRGKDVSLHRKGSWKRVSLRRHGGSERRRIRSLLHAPNSAPDVPVRYAREPGSAMRRHRPPGGVSNRSSRRVKWVCRRTGRKNIRKPTVNTAGPASAEGPVVADKNRRTGR